ncbi:brain-enriched guanylate kinase-associated protein [Ictalurus furcatus]|uniref:brain-enriched guanylate kinase-associated protein n=1 Tax=Ictalurus furcatus TaxID=66913 RepID=UPI002350E5A2|nr:brain-enriched guanylate kinase-associated protein [Ictalurus furcatus]
MKKIYIGKTGLKSSRAGCKHQKKSSLQEQKEDLRKRLSFTTQKLELLESEFDSTRQYLETELRRAQEELDKFTDKLRRIQSSYSALQRINQDLEDKIHRTSQHHDDEKRALSHEIIVLNTHLMEAKITIEKLKEDNDIYRKDCNLAAQLLQCNQSQYRAQLSELPADFLERLSLHIEDSSPICRSPYSDPIPSSVMANVLEKPEEASRSPSPTRHELHEPHEHPGFLIGTPVSGDERLGLGLRGVAKCDVYSSDTALYCPDERRRERRPSVDLHRFPHFNTSVGGASSSYSSFSGGGSEEKGAEPPYSTTSSPQHHGIYMEWRDGVEYEHKSDDSWERESPSAFSASHAYQNGGSPLYSGAMSCYSEPYEPLPPSTSPSVNYGDSRRGSALVPEEEEEPEEEQEVLIGRWRRLSVEDVSAHSFCSAGRASPYSFSEQHFSVRPAKIRLGPLYSSFQEGSDAYRHHGTTLLDPFSSADLRNTHLYSTEDENQEVEQQVAGLEQQYEDEEVDVSPTSSNESLEIGSMEIGAELQSFQPDRISASPQETSSPQNQAASQYQTFTTLGLTRKDSLTKAQLYGTLLN